MTVEIEIDESTETEVHVQKTIELSSEEILEQLDISELAEILETAIGPLLDDLYRAVIDKNGPDTDCFFDRIYETIDRSKPKEGEE